MSQPAPFPDPHRQLDDEAFDLRTLGLGGSDVAAIQGVDRSTAHRRAVRAYERRENDEPETGRMSRAIELAKLEKIEKPMLIAAMKGDKAAARIMLQIIACRRWLVGHDRATIEKHEPTPPPRIILMPVHSREEADEYEEMLKANWERTCADFEQRRQEGRVGNAHQSPTAQKASAGGRCPPYEAEDAPADATPTAAGMPDLAAIAAAAGVSADVVVEALKRHLDAGYAPAGPEVFEEGYFDDEDDATAEVAEVAEGAKKVHPHQPAATPETPGNTEKQPQKPATSGNKTQPDATECNKTQQNATPCGEPPQQVDELHQQVESHATAWPVPEIIRPRRPRRSPYCT